MSNSNNVSVYDEFYVKAKNALQAACDSFKSGNFQNTVDQLMDYNKTLPVLGAHAKEFVLTVDDRTVPATAKAVQEMMTNASKSVAIEMMDNVRARKARAFNGAQMYGDDLTKLGMLCQVGAFGMSDARTSESELIRLSGRKDVRRFFVLQVGMPGA
jgi:hypothetical protein